MLRFNVDDARTKLGRAANETDFEAAKDYARRAKNSLQGAAMSAMDCGCDMAVMEFDTAATHAKRARDADSPQEFIDSLNRAIRAFNSALDALRMCTTLRRWILRGTEESSLDTGQESKGGALFLELCKYDLPNKSLKRDAGKNRRAS